MQITGAIDIEENPDNVAFSQYTNMPRLGSIEERGGSSPTKNVRRIAIPSIQGVEKGIRQKVKKRSF